MLVGQALIASGAALACPSWGVKGDARHAAIACGLDIDALKRAEAPVEQLVSQYLGKPAGNLVRHSRPSLGQIVCVAWSNETVLRY